MTAPARLRNVLLKCALVVMSVALAAFGVMGWADAARALGASSWADLDPLWPVYGVAAIACLAAQVIAACAVVNFARLARAHWVWRGLAGAFYAVSVFFAAYSADRGAQVVLQSAHRAAYEAREAERAALSGEIGALAQAIEAERQRLPRDTANVVAERQRAALASYEAATQVERARLPEAQAELASKPSLPREPHMALLNALGVFSIFLGWAILEPWGYALAERGREIDDAPPPRQRRDNVHWLGRLAASLALWWAPQGTPTSAAAAPEPISISQWQDAKQVAFSMRGRFEVAEIAAKVGRDKSTVYRWFRKRDAERAQAA